MQGQTIKAGDENAKVGLGMRWGPEAIGLRVRYKRDYTITEIIRTSEYEHTYVVQDKC